MTRNPQVALSAYTQPVRVALHSDDPLLRAGLASLIEVGDPPLLQVVERADAEVVLWDAGTDPALVLARLAEIDRGAPVPVVAVVSDPSHVTPAIAAGARGVVMRDQVHSGLYAALVAVKSGLTVLDTELASHLVGPKGLRIEPKSNGHRGELTARELQVVQLLAEGLSNKLVADRLGISDHTAKFHVNGVMAKLGASTRTEAVVEAVRRGVVHL
jgi:two-component system, NarL family, nitrate/nitrite response regulator NarL